MASDHAFGWLHNVGDKLDKGGFARSVQADDTNPRAHVDAQIDIPKYGTVLLGIVMEGNLV